MHLCTCAESVTPDEGAPAHALSPLHRMRVHLCTRAESVTPDDSYDASASPRASWIPARVARRVKAAVHHSSFISLGQKWPNSEQQVVHK